MDNKQPRLGSYDQKGYPLSWAESRYRLRETLKSYLKDPVVPSEPQGKHSTKEKGESRSHSAKGLLGAWIRDHDIDLWLAVLLSLLLLIITILLYLSSNDPSFLEWLQFNNGSRRFPRLPRGASIAELIGSAVVFLESLLGNWIVRRRCYLLTHDSEEAKQREIRKYLHCTKEQEDDVNCELLNHLTSLTGVFPVYRRTSGGGSGASWRKLPSLLVVHGDWIALQVGDFTPATVTPLNGGSGESIHIRRGEQLTIDHMPTTASGDLKERIPKGRIPIQPDSDHLLELSNCLQIFRVQETPLDDFLRRPSATYRPSRLARQVESLRVAMTGLAVLLFCLSLAIIFVRRAYAMIHVPFLVALGVLPVYGPLVCFFLEIIGTSRILASVHPHSVHNAETLTRPAAIFRHYLGATTLSRLSLWKFYDSFYADGVRIPPSSVPLLESLGSATAFTLVDDELVCEPHSIPQQLLIPSRKGLKLLDLCPLGDTMGQSNDDRSRAGSDSDTTKHETTWRRARGKSFDSDESEDSETSLPVNTRSLRKLPQRLRRRRLSSHNASLDEAEGAGASARVQFEEPNWWQFLPSLKCIGLACLLNEEAKQTGVGDVSSTTDTFDRASAQASLIRLACHERHSRQLKALAECIGFSTEPNAIGDRGDISAFKECLRIQLISGELLRTRTALDAHERGTEQNKWWGLLRPDSTSVVVEDTRTQAHQLLTVGDPSVVTELCNEAWQGEISTILPLAPLDRQAILDTARDWKLGDLDVAAFSYTPVPYTLESRLGNDPQSHVYLLDNSDSGVPIMKDKALPEEWTFIKNQVFLGVLGSLVVPRKETQRLLKMLNTAGVRFVYFSPRNMRRQKELASQMGIDVAWNCAISLRPLGKGCELDPHRMVSHYADWTVNAKLPHGVDAVRTHLREVDNVPLLVSLFTDATKETTREMVEVFQEHHDTVVSLGFSHFPRNESIFCGSDISIGVDVLRSESSLSSDADVSETNLGPDLEFVSAISAHSCAFRLRGLVPTPHIASILSKSRASQEAVTASGVFFSWCSVSYSIFAFLALCNPMFVVPFVSTAAAAIIFQFVVLLSLSLAMTEGDPTIMKRVPAKNDITNTFGRKEGSMFYARIVLKAIPPAILPQALYLIVIGSFVKEACTPGEDWTAAIRCRWGTTGNGSAWVSGGALVAMSFAANLAISSSGFVHRFLPLHESCPWRRNFSWLVCVVIVLCLVSAIAMTLKGVSFGSIPWYAVFLVVASPVASLAIVEYLKRTETREERRSDKLRRLQFETRLGQWSPR